MKKSNTIVLVIILLTLLVGLGFISGHGEEDELYDDHHRGMMGGFWGGGYSGMFGFFWIFWALLLIALVLLIAWLIKQLSQSNQGKGRKRR